MNIITIINLIQNNLIWIYFSELLFIFLNEFPQTKHHYYLN